MPPRILSDVDPYPGSPGSFPGHPFGMPVTPFNPRTGKYLPLGPVEEDEYTNEIVEYTLVSQSSDYITCTNEGGETFNIAKPYLLRTTPFDGATIDYGDQQITYTYVSDILRLSGGGDDIEVQAIYPPYFVGELIRAANHKTGLLDDSEEMIKWEDINSAGRVWMTKDTLMPCVVVSESNDYLTCTDPNGVSVSVAKPHMLQRTPFHGVAIAYPGQTVTYTYASATQRSATDGVDTEDQYMTPLYYVGETILASNHVTAIVDGNGDLVTWMDINTAARAWAAR